MNAKQGKSKLTAAFSLIELMVVVAIIALLTAIAVPSYKTYIQQAKVAQVTNFIQNFEEQWQQVDTGALGTCPASAGAAQGTYISNVQFYWKSAAWTTSMATTAAAGSLSCTAQGAISGSGATNGTGGILVTLNSSAVTDWGYCSGVSCSGNGAIAVFPVENSFSSSGSAPQTGDKMFNWNCVVGATGNSTAQSNLVTLLGNLSGAVSSTTTCSNASNV